MLAMHKVKTVIYPQSYHQSQNSPSSDLSIPSKQIETVDLFIDLLETILDTNSSENITVLSTIHQHLEAKNLPPIELLTFDGNPSCWPKFIENFKIMVHLKLVSAIFLSNFYFSPNDSPSKTMENVFYFI